MTIGELRKALDAHDDSLPVVITYEGNDGFDETDAVTGIRVGLVQEWQDTKTDYQHGLVAIADPQDARAGNERTAMSLPYGAAFIRHEP